MCSWSRNCASSGGALVGPGSEPARLSISQQSITAITLAEVCSGAHTAGRVDLYERVRQRFRDVEVLAFDTEAAERYGPLRAALERRRQRIDEADLRIACICLAHGRTLVTGNTRHFAKIDELRVENWL